MSATPNAASQHSATKRRSLLLRAIAWLLIPAMALSSGCVPNRKLVYLQDAGQKAGDSPLIYTAERHPYHLQTGDVLSVIVKGVDQELQNTFNTTSGGFGATFADPNTQYVNGYSIDENGDISLTSVGKVRVRGLTVTEASELCQKRIANYLREATVSVKLVSFKITVLGEVKKPGYYYVANTRCNLLEGIGLGGDLGQVANRRRVKIIRQTPQGAEIAMVDLTDANLVRSPYYNLQPNDIIYVEPLPGQTAQKNFAPATLGLGIVSGLATVILLVFTIRNNYK